MDVAPIVAGIFILGIVIGISELLSYVKHKNILKSVKEKPEVAEKLKTVLENQRIRKIIPEMIPKKVKVVVLQKEGQLEDICRYDGEMITCRHLKMQFIPPSDYKPRPTLYKRKIMLTYFFTEDGKPVEINVSNPSIETNIKLPDPRMMDVIINRRLIHQVFSHLGTNWNSVIMGMGLGAMILAVIIFFILPLVGVPVMIGRQHIEVIHVQQTAPSTPPPANYTVVIPSG